MEEAVNGVAATEAPELRDTLHRRLHMEVLTWPAEPAEGKKKKKKKQCKQCATIHIFNYDNFKHFHKLVLHLKFYHYYYYIPDCDPQLGEPDAKNPMAPGGKTAQ